MTTDEIPVSLIVSRAGGSLQLEAPGSGRELVSWGASGRTWRRSVVDGRWVHGRTLLSATMEQGVASLVMRVHGSTWVQARQRMNEVIDALSQERYLLTATVDGAIDRHVCEPADMELAGGSEWNKYEIMENQQTLVFTIPYHPTRTAL